MSFNVFVDFFKLALIKKRSEGTSLVTHSSPLSVL